MVFSKKLSIVLLLCCHYAAVHGVNFKNPNAMAHNPCADIRNGQLVCLDCATLALCMQVGGDWATLEIETCRTDKQIYCNENAKGCTLQLNEECQVPMRGLRFECQNPGTYPDPYDCRYYHECSGMNVDTRHICPSGWGYAVSQQQCIALTSSAECTKPQYTCEKPGSTGTWPGDENIYYVCTVQRVDDDLLLYPLLYRCSTGMIFDGNRCVATAQDKTESSDDQVGGPPSTLCTNNEFITNLSDCHAYYRCTNGKLTAHTCPSGSYYNSARQACVTGSC